MPESTKIMHIIKGNMPHQLPATNLTMTYPPRGQPTGAAPRLRIPSSGAFIRRDVHSLVPGELTAFTSHLYLEMFHWCLKWCILRRTNGWHGRKYTIREDFYWIGRPRQGRKHVIGMTVVGEYVPTIWRACNFSASSWAMPVVAGRNNIVMRATWTDCRTDATGKAFWGGHGQLLSTNRWL